MELRHLRYFVVVTETLKFTKGAERLRVAQRPSADKYRTWRMTGKGTLTKPIFMGAFQALMYINTSPTSAKPSFSYIE
jgi:hypothetical protein